MEDGDIEREKELVLEEREIMGEEIVNTPKEVESSPSPEGHLACFGHPSVFDENDDECKACHEFKACMRTVLRQKKAK